MSESFRVVVLTSDALRHRFVVNRLAESAEIVGVWQEAKSFNPLASARSDAEEAVIREHFAGRAAAEERDFAGAHDLDVGSAVVRRVPPGGLTDPEEAAAIYALRPDALLVFGTGILREPLLSQHEGRIINLHLGLSPYYRGSGTNFWPLVNREPEYVGATIHVLDAGIDTGPMLAHVRPEWRADDGPHEAGNRTIAAAAGRLVEVARAYLGGSIDAVPQPGGGRLYLRRDFDAAAVRRMYRQFETGMVAEYMVDRERREAAMDLLEPWRDG